MTKSLLLHLVGPSDQLARCWQAGATMLASVDFGEDSESERHQVLLALQEMVTNVIRHAYGGDQSRPIEVEFSVDEQNVVIELRDRGPEFDPLARDPSGRIEDDSMPTVVGGFGIHIVRVVMDDLSYARKDGWNVLRMTKRIPVAAPSREARS
jgi:serine/threonine-protein kinase RsbW